MDLTTLLSTTAGKAIVGTAVAAAGLGGLTAAGAVELPTQASDADAVIIEETPVDAADIVALTPAADDADLQGEDDATIDETQTTEDETQTNDVEVENEASGGWDSPGVDGQDVSEDAQDGGVEGQEVADQAISGTPAENTPAADRESAHEDAGTQDDEQTADTEDADTEDDEQGGERELPEQAEAGADNRP